MFARFVCALLSFRAREFPVKSETREPGEIVMGGVRNGLRGRMERHRAEEREARWSGVQEGVKGRNQREVDGLKELRGGGGLENYDGVPPPPSQLPFSIRSAGAIY